MSAKNVQSDTSRVIVKNPLLSTVAGSIDDFVNNTILLPAAEIPTPIALSSQHPIDSQDLKDNRGKKKRRNDKITTTIIVIEIIC